MVETYWIIEIYINRMYDRLGEQMDEQTKTEQIKVIQQASDKLGSQAELARKLQIFPQCLNRYATAKRELPLGIYLAIKRITKGSRNEQ